MESLKSQCISGGQGIGPRLSPVWHDPRRERHDILFLRRDRQRSLVVLPWHVYIRFMQAYQRTTDDAQRPPV
jgi:hypothetical protein